MRPHSERTPSGRSCLACGRGRHRLCREGTHRTTGSLGCLQLCVEIENKIGRFKEICRREYYILYDIIVLPQAEQLVEVHPRPVEGHQSIRHNEGNLPVHTHTLLQSTKQNININFVTYNRGEHINVH